MPAAPEDPPSDGKATTGRAYPARVVAWPWTGAVAELDAVKAAFAVRWAQSQQALCGQMQSVLRVGEAVSG